MTKLSVIIPVVNEELTIVGCLEQFRATPEVEVLVVDGGSRDNTQARLGETGLGRLISSSEQSRAGQMNLGASCASGDVLLFLHADTRLPETWLEDVRRSVRGGAVGGSFRLVLSEPTLLYRCIGFLSTLRSRFLGVTYGDQGVYATRQAYADAGGFPERQVFEDSEFCTALSRTGRFEMLKSSVETSTRRWRQGGVLTTVLWMWALRLMYLCSIPDARLSRLYHDVRRPVGSCRSAVRSAG